MTRYRFGAGVALLLAISLVACSKDTAVREDVDAVTAFSRELVNKVKSGASPADGVAAAQAYLDEHKSDIVARMARVNSVRGFQISDETKQQVMDGMMTATSEVNTLKISLVTLTISDDALDRSLNKLVDEFNALLTGA
jgi:hypothetical protein